MAGTVNNYFVQDLWTVSLIYKEKPEIHYDIGSRLDGFIAYILAMEIPAIMIDIRPFPVEISGLTTIVEDATNLRQFTDNSIESLSDLFSLWHFGLGRYEDSIDPEACFQCFSSIIKSETDSQKILKLNFADFWLGYAKCDCTAENLWRGVEQARIILTFVVCKIFEKSGKGYPIKHFYLLKI